MDFTVSAASSLSSSAIVYPLDILKTQYQVARVNRNINPSVLDISKNIIKKQGLKGFYRGLGPHLTTYPFFWGVYFETNRLNFKPTGYLYLDKVFMAYASGFIAGTLANPLWVIKTRFQTEILKTYGSDNKIIPKVSYVQFTKNMYKNEGIASFWKGWGTTQLNNLKLGVQFPLYDFLKDKTENIFFSSTFAKLLSSTVFYPLDLIRTNQRESTVKLYAVDCSKKIYKKDGLRGFYRGVGLYNLTTGPNFVLMMVIRDFILNFT
jgi:solute carrier family 25 folate transporter 32